ncbi:MAG: hypothetical protein MK066_09040 [Crocinitomicaceae bacterium]|nr:hypothetical protein [Crocinitomicaceae bacterium]
MKKIICGVLFLMFVSSSMAQKYSETTLRSTLDSIAIDHPGLDNKLQLNVSSLQLSELVNSVALENNLNVSVEPSLKQLISYNFYDAQVKDMLVFLYLNFELEYDFIGSIISIRKREATPVKKIVAAPKKIDIKYNPANKFLSMNLKGDTLWKVMEELTKITGKNFVLDPTIRDQKVNAYFLNRPDEKVLEMFAKSNELELIPIDDYYSVGKGEAESTASSSNNKRGSSYRPNSKNGDFVLTKNPVGTIDVFARNVELKELIQAAAEETGVHYVVYSDIKGKTNLDLKDIRFDELLSIVFSGTAFSAKEENGVYIIGENKMDGIRKTEMIRLENRTIESVKDAIPKDMLVDLEVKEFNELNGLIVTGGQRKIEELARFISTIDVVVPMVQIDVMLLFSSKGSTFETGMKAGIKDTPTSTREIFFQRLMLS